MGGTLCTKTVIMEILICIMIVPIIDKDNHNGDGNGNSELEHKGRSARVRCFRVRGLAGAQEKANLVDAGDVFALLGLGAGCGSLQGGGVSWILLVVFVGLPSRSHSIEDTARGTGALCFPSLGGAKQRNQRKANIPPCGDDEG